MTILKGALIFAGVLVSIFFIAWASWWLQPEKKPTPVDGLSDMSRELNEVLSEMKANHDAAEAAGPDEHQAFHDKIDRGGSFATPK